ncbi:MAG: sugar phosphate isomerase/epimerase [Verrucomicrobiae bacterium]|nr:sugar phosphate isomerase/epimerase [Verrucomicrobiae bacterium]MCP5542091.1 sugar phosphate isomerase/epimerase [Akkermansiaceae bacterium]
MQNSADVSPNDESKQPVAIGRRGLLASAGLLAGATTLGSGLAAEAPSAVKRFKFCLNMSTIRGQELDAAEEIEVAAKAGYDAIEPWYRKIYEYVEKGGSLKDLKKRIDDHGLTVESAIGFAPWIVNDDDARAKGLEEAKKDMDTISQLGGIRMAAPPAGVSKGEIVSLDDAADRYRALLELGDRMGVVPQVEMWGGNPTIGTMEKALYVAIRSGHPKACFLGDVYHTYKGGSSFDSILLLGPRAIQHYHMNDYPADPPRETIKDEHRVFTGDGIAPITRILRNFMAVGAWPSLSLELFNKTYWAMPALECAKVGLEKMKASVEAATARA